jgi:hypothetical protein
LLATASSGTVPLLAHVGVRRREDRLLGRVCCPLVPIHSVVCSHRHSTLSLSFIGPLVTAHPLVRSRDCRRTATPAPQAGHSSSPGRPRCYLPSSRARLSTRQGNARKARTSQSTATQRFSVKQVAATHGRGEEAFQLPAARRSGMTPLLPCHGAHARTEEGRESLRVAHVPLELLFLFGALLCEVRSQPHQLLLQLGAAGRQTAGAVV